MRLVALLLLLFIFFYALMVWLNHPIFFEKYDMPMLIFLFTVYSMFYVIDFFLKNKLSPEKQVAKDLVFIVLKFLSILFYAAIKNYSIEETDKKNFLIHFLIYGMALMIADTLINYHLIDKENKKIK